jgi:N-acetylneuraminate lyase
MLTLRGIIPALFTPFDAAGNVNPTMARELIEHLLPQGVGGFYVCGGTGEGILLTEAERRLMAETAVDQVAGRAPVVVHVGAITTAEACRLAAHAEQAGADGISSIPPFYYNPGFLGVKEHYRAIGAASELPLYVYNIPGATGINVTPAMFLEMCQQIPTLAGMKFTSYNFFEMRQIIDLDVGGRALNIVSGPDEMMLAAQAMGADGAIGLTYNFIGKLFVDAYHAFHAGEIARAKDLQAKANRIIQAYQVVGGISAAKAIMKLSGFDCGTGRRPNPPTTEAHVAKLKDALDKADYWNLAVTR